MHSSEDRTPEDDGILALELFLIDPAAIGGIHLRAPPGPLRDAYCSMLQESLPPGTPCARMPLHITDDRLLGGISLAATLRTGRAVLEAGLLAEANGGVVVVSMAERVEGLAVSSLSAALDFGDFALERDGLTRRVACRIGVLALDEGLGDERAPDALRDRLAFSVELDDARRSSARVRSTLLEEARARLRSVRVDDAVVEALASATLSLGIDSLRAPILAVAAARACAALAGRSDVNESDAAAAARLVLGHRATRLPAPPAGEQDLASAESSPEESQPEPPPPPPAPPPGAEDSSEEDPHAEMKLETPSMEDIVLAATRSSVPAGLLAGTAAPRLRTSTRAGRAGAPQRSASSGRAAGTTATPSRPDARLNIVETLRAAAPWQRARRQREADATELCRIDVRKEDFRFTTFKHKAESCVIFVVDASGSAAARRLSEAKGGVEQLLIDCYARRDHVALIGFRGTTASLLLPPTRSLVTVRRSLADLPGGGATPLASGIDASLVLALDAQRKGRTPIIVLMTDARGNVSRTGKAGAAAAVDSVAAARAVRAAGVRSLLLDTSPRPRAQARELAVEMGARYVALPYLDASAISRQVRSLADGPS